MHVRTHTHLNAAIDDKKVLYLIKYMHYINLVHAFYYTAPPPLPPFFHLDVTMDDRLIPCMQVIQSLY